MRTLHKNGFNPAFSFGFSRRTAECAEYAEKVPKTGLFAPRTHRKQIHPNGESLKNSKAA